MPDGFILVRFPRFLLRPFRSPIMTRLPNSEQEHRRPNDYCKYISLSYLDTS
jgi:hypothetical protein